MKKQFWGILAVMFTLILLLLLILNNLTNKVNEYNESIKINVGNEIVLDNDTLMIIDYSIINNNYILTDGRTISFELYEKLKLD